MSYREGRMTISVILHRVTTEISLVSFWLLLYYRLWQHRAAHGTKIVKNMKYICYINQEEIVAGQEFFNIKYTQYYSTLTDVSELYSISF
jgi:hypothetical protein